MISFNDDGEVVFELYLPHAQGIEVMGDFTGWEESPVRMSRRQPPEEGWWQVRHKLGPGEYTFSYLVDGRSWLPDYAAGGMKRNAHGRWTSVLCIAAPVMAAPPAAQQVIVTSQPCAATPKAEAATVAPPPRSRRDREERVRTVQDADVAREFSTSRLSGHRHSA